MPKFSKFHATFQTAFSTNLYTSSPVSPHPMTKQKTFDFSKNLPQLTII